MTEPRKWLIICLVLIFLLIPSSLLFSADLLVPVMELYSRGYIHQNYFVLDSRGLIDISIAGGYKVGGNIAIAVESNDLASFEEPPAVLFNSASVIARDLFSLPMNVTFFIGEYETYCNGDIFVQNYGTIPVASKYRGYLYFPTGIQYDGIFTPQGTGIEIETSENFSDIMQLSTAIYQNSILGKGIYTADVRSVFNFEQIKLDTFFAYSFPIGKLNYMHAGILFFYNTGIGGEFLMQIGIPKFDFYSDPFSINTLYFFFEPRVHFNIFSIFITLFWHPEFYQMESTAELGTADINLDFRIGDISKQPYAGGLEAAMIFQTADPGGDQFNIAISPYFSAITTGTIWDFKINFNLFPFNINDLFEGFIGVKAEF